MGELLYRFKKVNDDFKLSLTGDIFHERGLDEN